MAGDGREARAVTQSAASSMETRAGRAVLRLAPSARSRGTLLEARVALPQVVSTALVVVGDVARSRFFVPSAMVATRLRDADPVVTCHDDLVRFESFSQCGGVYARADVEQAALGGVPSRRGVVSVDFGSLTRSLLANVRPESELSIEVRGEGVSVTAGGSQTTEPVVPLEARWQRGFAEAQLAQRRCSHRFDLQRPAMQRLLGLLPSRTSMHRGQVVWVTAVRGGLPRLTTSPVGAVELGGPARLALLEPLLPLAQSISVYGCETPGVGSVWVAHLPGARVTLALSSDSTRDFSGEGRVTSALIDAEGLLAAAELRDRLDLDRRIAVDSDAARAGVEVLAALGEVGFDIHDGTTFHRPLPRRTMSADVLHPRLRDAYRLVEQRAVFLLGDGRASVRSGGVDHLVTTGPGASTTCTCPWSRRHRGERGPCKHELAARLASSDPQTQPPADVGD